MTIGVCRAGLEYHTRASMTVNVAFKGPVKRLRRCCEGAIAGSSVTVVLLGIARETLRYGPPRSATPTP